MTNLLMKYMGQRFSDEADQPVQKKAGPVVTISRETGCPSKRISNLLAEKLNEQYNLDTDKKWKTISKEILYDSAKELELNPAKIKYVFEYQEKGMWDDLLSSFSSKYYKSDRKIRRVITEVVRTIAETGHAIIIGRGGVAIAKDIPMSLHINLVAPLEWRSLILSKKFDMNIDEAKQYAVETDNKRKKFRDSFQGKGTDYTWFDVSYDCMTLTDEEIVHSIIAIMKYKGLTNL